ncbi:MAG: cell wall hydrolase [Firmicutes bacterium]|nr:cell wall hydrolase [Bacillota bacterium]
MNRCVAVIFATIILMATPGQAHAPLLPPALWQPMALPRVIQDPRVELLAHLIHAEARGECFTGQVAVGSVVLNRVRDHRFPGTVHAVIHQPRQFCPVPTGLLEPGDTATQAARSALAGADPTGGALYFYNSAISDCDWIRTRGTVCDIGRHRFAK